MTFTVHQAVPTLAVPDLEAGLAFYERLGFARAWTFPEEQPTHAGLELGDASLMLCCCDPWVYGDVVFVVTGVAAFHAAVLESRCWELAGDTARMGVGPQGTPARALEPPAAPEAREYGMCDFVMVDPWGHQLTFGEPLPGLDDLPDPAAGEG